MDLAPIAVARRYGAANHAGDDLCDGVEAAYRVGDAGLLDPYGLVLGGGHQAVSLTKGFPGPVRLKALRAIS